MKILKQESNISCGIACLRSIFSHCGMELSEEEILKKNKFFEIKDGVLNPLISLGVVALKFGFNVKYVGFNPMLINNNRSEDLKESLLKKSKEYYDYGKFCVDQMLEFMDLRGEVSIDKLNVDKIKKLIDDHGFVLFGVRPAFINKNSTFNKMHKIIIDGYSEKEFHILDPDGSEYDLDFDTFLMALYSMMPEALIIWK